MTDQPDVIGRRIGAALLDSLLLFVVFVVLGIAIGDSSSSGSSASVNLGSGGTLIWVLIAVAYYTVAEGSSGQTLGKRALGLRVVREDGGAPGYGTALARTVLRVIDGLPFLYLLGFVVVLATGAQRRQRLGDLAAKTRVVPA